MLKVADIIDIFAPSLEGVTHRYWVLYRSLEYDYHDLLMRLDWMIEIFNNPDVLDIIGC